MEEQKVEQPQQPTQQPQVQVIQVAKQTKDGQVKCPGCGASELTPDPKTGKLKCGYCGMEFDGNTLNIGNDIFNLKGTIIGMGAKNIKKDANDTVTLKCGGCGAEVVIDTAHAPHARCHWCRSILSINSQIENGSIPDAILPFKTPKEEAREKIDTFVKKRTFFAHPTFKKEFTTENIMGVYYPYLLVDANCHATFSGEGEHLVRRYTVGSGDDRETRYDADAYNVSREFDIAIDDLTIESNSDRLDKTSNDKTNNIINSIMPFDTENCLEYQSNYLVGYTSERRDMNIEELNHKVGSQLKDIGRYSIKPDLKFYDRGIRWDTEDFKVIGTRWLAAYLPVWLYSYMQVKGDKKILHYVAVNARTGETMGSVPINMPLLIGISAIIEAICIVVGLMLFFAIAASDSEDSNPLVALLIFLGGFIFYGIMYARYRNKGARHTYEKETHHMIKNIIRKDELLEHRKGLRNSQLKNRNDEKIEGDSIQPKKSILEKIQK